MKIWVVQVNYGIDTIDTLYFSGKIDKEKIIEMMLYRVYVKGEWKEIYDCIFHEDTGKKHHNSILIQTYDNEYNAGNDKDLVSIYHTDILPDIEIFPIELDKMKKYGKHDFDVRREVYVPIHIRKKT